MCNGGSAELTRERDGWRKKLTATKSTLTVRLLQLGRSNGNIWSAEIKNGLYSAVYHSGAPYFEEKQ